MFYLSYVLAELRRRGGRTVLTALGLAVGVALVVTVNAFSTGLDNAQATVLRPLTGVGTDMTVTRPIHLSTSGGGPFASLSPQERQQLLQENGAGRRFDFRKLAKPGAKFDVDRFVATSQLSFPQSTVSRVAKMSGVAGTAGSLTLTDTHVSGSIPKNLPQPGQGGFGGGRFGGGGFGGTGGEPGGGGGGFFGPRAINFSSRTVTGIDISHGDLAPVTPAQITSGRYIKSSDGGYAAILSTNYASLNGLSAGSKITLGGKTFHVVGLASSPLGGTASDVYIPLATLQSMSGHQGRINTLQVRATSDGNVSSVQHEITGAVAGAQVTTAADLAKRVGGSLVDAKNISNSLGKALEIVGLLAAVLIAILLTLSSVTKRVRELGTLRAIGWSRALVVRQVSLEVLIQGVIGGIVGALLGLVATGVVTAMSIPLQATISSPQNSSPFGLGRFFRPGAAPTGGSTTVHLTAPANLDLLLLAVGLAVLGGLVAGGIGGMRAAQLRPAAALRAVE